MIVSTYSTTKILEEMNHIYKAYMGEIRYKLGSSHCLIKEKLRYMVEDMDETKNKYHRAYI